ncbi:ABC transporter permease [Bacillota bacterium Meth-B3]
MNRERTGRRGLLNFLLVERRNATLSAVTTMLAVGIALLLAFALIFVVSRAPGEAIYQFLIGPFTSVRQMGNILTTASTIGFTGVAVCLMFQASMFNMAAEGACFVGALAAAGVATKLQLPPALAIVLPIITGIAAGALLGLVPGLLRARLNANEMVSSLMINYISLYGALFVLKNYLIDKTAGQIATGKMPKASKLANILPGTGVHAGVILVVIVVLLAYLYLYKTRQGSQLRVYGQNPSFARYAGVNVAGVIVSSQVLGGAVAGLGGAVEIMGMYQRFQWTALPGYGWDGIIIAILARNKPQFVPLAALFIAYLRTGANMMNTYADVPKELITVIQAILMILVTAAALTGGLKQRIAVKEALGGADR